MIGNTIPDEEKLWMLQTKFFQIIESLCTREFTDRDLSSLQTLMKVFFNYYINQFPESNLKHEAHFLFLNLTTAILKIVLAIIKIRKMLVNPWQKSITCQSNCIKSGCYFRSWRRNCCIYKRNGFRAFSHLLRSKL